MVARIRVLFSQLAVRRHHCRRFIQDQLRKRNDLCVKVMDTLPESDCVSYMPVSLLQKIEFLSMQDISTPSVQCLIGKLKMDGEESPYILTSSSTDVVLYIYEDDLVRTRIVLPLSMDARTSHTIHVPLVYSKNEHVVPNEITLEFLDQFQQKI